MSVFVAWCILIWQLSGEIPDEIEQCTFLHTLELQDNQLSGVIPMALWNCLKLVTLALEGNNLFGEILVPFLARLRLLTSLSLHDVTAAASEPGDVFIFN